MLQKYFMAEVNYWEKEFIDRFVVNDRKERYLEFLKGRKRRAEFLDELNHKLQYDRSKATVLPAQYREPKALISFLNSFYVEPTCHLIADSTALDGKEIRTTLAVPELLNNYCGAVMICPPKPIVIYKEEDL